MNPSTPNAALTSRLATRPTPPGRTKRHSLTPTSRANISRSIDAAKANAGTSKGDGSTSSGLPAPVPSPRGALMQGLRERNEEDIGRAGRVELERVLREEWESKDRLAQRIENLIIEQDRLEADRKELVQSLGGLQSRVDEAFSEQGRLEQDVESRDQMLERMRLKGAETDKALREAQKRYTEQEKSFEAEREAYRAQETHLQSRIHTLTRSSTLASRADTPSSSLTSPIDQAQVEALNEELASLSAAHCSLIAQYNTTSKEVADLKSENKRLEEENAGWELLMRDQTMSGSVRGRGMFSEDWLDEGELSEDGDDKERDLISSKKSPEAEQNGGVRRSKGRGRTVLESLDEEMEMGLEEEHVGAGMQSLVSGGDLAAELGRANEGASKPSGSENVDVQAVKPTESDALRAEIKSLKDANKALSLYCSKIIDRIIAQEGFEHVLSVDYKTRRGRSAADSSAMAGAVGTDMGMGTSGKPRGSVQDLVHNMHARQGPGGDDFLQKYRRSSAGMTEAAGPASEAQVPQSIVTPPTPAKEPRKARPLSMMVRGWSYAGDNAKEKEKEKEKEAPSRQASVSPEKAAQAVEEEVKAEKRAKRGFSIDFRSFGFGSSAASTSPTEPKGLKPLTLPQRQASGSYTSGSLSADRSRAASPIVPSPTEGHARKLPQMEEDEEDKRERHRMEAAMRLMGINRGESYADPESEALTPVPRETNGRAEMLSSPVDLGLSDDLDSPASASGSRSPEKPRVPLAGTPLSRLHSALSTTSRTSSPMLELADPMSPVDDTAAAAALKAFDAREAEQARMLAQGKAMTEFTTPRKIGEGRRRASGRRGPVAAGVGAQAPSSPDTDIGRGFPPKGRTVSKSESISTLFSAGTDSPSGSVDLGRGG